MGDVVIIGAGITGCCAAYFLARAGVSTTVIERSEIASQATAHNPGGLNPLHGPGIPGAMSALASRSFELHLDHRDEIARLSEMDHTLRRVSRIELAFDETQVAELKGSMARYSDAEGFAARWLDRADLRRLEPRLGSEAVGGLLIDGNGMVDSRAYSVAIWRAAQQLGARLIQADAAGVEHHGSRISAVELHSGRSVSCNALVLTTGPWVSAAERWLGLTIPVEPLKGELLLVRMPGARFQHHVSWGPMGIYNLPDGRAWLGGTQQRVGFDATPSAQGRETIVKGIRRLVPRAAEAPVLDHVAALRPVTPDGLPIIDRAPGWENVFIVTGAGTKGILIGAGMGEALAKLVTGASPDVSVGPFALDRFDADPLH